MPVWTVAEQAQNPKRPVLGEDRLVLRGDGAGLRLCAVVDGATNKSGRTFGGLSGGAVAAQCIADTLAEHAADLSPADAVAVVTDRLAALRGEWAIASDDLVAPSAVAAVFVPQRGEIWRVGDVHVALRGATGNWQVYPADKAIRQVVAAARAALLHCLLAGGASVAELAATDPGRAMVMPLLGAQAVLANRDDGYPLGHGVLDGQPVPARYLDVIAVRPDVREVVLASDGYLSPAPDLSGRPRHTTAHDNSTVRLRVPVPHGDQLDDHDPVPIVEFGDLRERPRRLAGGGRRWRSGWGRRRAEGRWCGVCCRRPLRT